MIWSAKIPRWVMRMITKSFVSNNLMIQWMSQHIAISKSKKLKISPRFKHLSMIASSQRDRPKATRLAVMMQKSFFFLRNSSIVLTQSMNSAIVLWKKLKSTIHLPTLWIMVRTCTRLFFARSCWTRRTLTAWNKVHTITSLRKMKVESSELTSCLVNTIHWTSRLLKKFTSPIFRIKLWMKTVSTDGTVSPTRPHTVEPLAPNPKPTWLCLTQLSSKAPLKVYLVKESVMRMLESLFQSTVVLTKMNCYLNSTRSNAISHSSPSKY